MLLMELVCCAEFHLMASMSKNGRLIFESHKQAF